MTCAKIYHIVKIITSLACGGKCASNNIKLRYDKNCKEIKKSPKLVTLISSEIFKLFFQQCEVTRKPFTAILKYCYISEIFFSFSLVMFLKIKLQFSMNFKFCIFATLPLLTKCQMKWSGADHVGPETWKSVLLSNNQGEGSVSYIQKRSR